MVKLKRLFVDHALSSGSQVKLLMPLLGETGCRLAEIVGLELDDIDISTVTIGQISMLMPVTSGTAVVIED